MRRLIDRFLARPSVLGGLALMVSCGWVMLSNWNPVVHGHPSYLVFYMGLAAAGVGVVAVGPSRPASSRRGWSAAAAVGMLLLSVVALWLSPFGADAKSIEAMEGADGFQMVESWTSIVLEPETTERRAGLVFFPGARVDARAYSRMLIPITEAGFEVVIVKAPLGIAFLSSGFAESWIEQNPDIGAWLVGGHSLGGVVASTSAETHMTDGLLLWASYPAGDISGADTLHVASVYGTNDGLTEPERVRASAADLPSSTVFYEIEGAVHSHFGEYGAQPGDGQPSISEESARRQIIEATLDFLQELPVSPVG